MAIRGRTIGTVVGLLALVTFAFNARDLYRWWKLATM
jgi:hypothetical protein